MSARRRGKPKLKIAVEGCGHGTLHSIYASVEKSSRVKGWDGVDVLIIGGDFQAVRNKYDLNVTAMPAKYRKMADFHEYYSGARSAPYLTIFIGGNHEASNHLFELYYGGWVAPNIYYMGAANILKLGPLRIAGLSGIWKGYDYRKPHFERVPYNDSESVSIFHVRELDVRKMLSVRTQVDVGLSHDWPQGVEWKGDYRSLFRKKDRFEADASEGKLGSIAARQCMDRLRPSHWFSAHLHVKYAAMIQHGEYENVRPPREYRPRHGVLLSEPVSSQANMRHKPEKASNFSNAYINSSYQDDHQDQSSRTTEGFTDDISSPLGPSPTAKSSPKTNPTPKAPAQAQVSAWQNFHVDGVKSETQETELRLRDQRAREAEEERTGTRKSPQYLFDETWKQVQADDCIERGIASVSKSIRSPGKDGKITHVDGCIESKLKRPRSNTADSVIQKDQTTSRTPSSRDVLSSQLDGHVPAAAITSGSAARNVDEIEIDLSDSSPEDAEAQRKTPRPLSSEVIPAQVGDVVPSQGACQSSNKRAKSEILLSDDSDEGGVKLDPTTPSFVPKARPSGQPILTREGIKEEATSKSDTMEMDQEDVSDTMRAQLAELSSAFAPLSNQQPASAPLPLPESIANTKTQFLALDKCEKGRDFLQLLEVESISEQTDLSDARPYTLQYDKEWLAILRVFAPELELGGEPNVKIPMHRGDTYYRERIVAEEEWIEEHVVRPGRLTVPQNFTITAPIYKPKEVVSPSDKPREYTNPQTSAFCELIGIDNKFDISEEEREERMTRGPRPDERKFSRGDRGSGHGERGFSARGRGNHNAGRGGRGRARGGRGRGRGW